MSTDSRRLMALLVALGGAAVVIGGVFLARAFAGEDSFGSWYSAGVGILGGGALALYAVAVLPRR